MDDIENKVNQIIIDVTGSNEKDLSDIIYDSLDLVQIIIDLEDVYDIEIHDDDVKNFKTVDDLINYVKDGVKNASKVN